MSLAKSIDAPFSALLRVSASLQGLLQVVGFQGRRFHVNEDGGRRDAGIRQAGNVRNRIQVRRLQVLQLAPFEGGGSGTWTPQAGASPASRRGLHMLHFATIPRSSRYCGTE